MLFKREDLKVAAHAESTVALFAHFNFRGVKLALCQLGCLVHTTTTVSRDYFGKQLEKLGV